VLDNPVDGVHAYVSPPTEVDPIDVDEPEQMVAFDPAAATGNGFTVNVPAVEV